LANLAKTRDELLPKLFGIADPQTTSDIALDIILQYTEDCLLVKGFNVKNKRSAGFEITSKSIDDGSYKDDFKPKVLALLGMLNQPLSETEIAASNPG
jgi:hypothetical protein